MCVMASCRESTSSTVHARHPYSTLRELGSPECIGRNEASRGPGCNTTCTSTGGEIVQSRKAYPVLLMSIVCRTYLVLLEGVDKGMEVRGVEQSRVDEKGLHGITGRWVVTLSVYHCVCVCVCGRQ